MKGNCIEVYSSHRNRKQYPSVGQFGVPFSVASDQEDDPVLSSPIYYTWSGLSDDSIISDGQCNVFSTNSNVRLLPALTDPPDSNNALLGYRLTVRNPLVASGTYAEGSTNVQPILDETASSVDDFYVGKILSDLISGEVRTIVAYNAVTKAVTLDTPFFGQISARGTNGIGSIDNGKTWMGGINAAQTIMYGYLVAVVGSRTIIVGSGVANSDQHAVFLYNESGGSPYFNFIDSLIIGQGIGYNNGLWIIVGFPVQGQSPSMVALSPDGLYWTYQNISTSPFSVGGYGVVSNGTGWVAVGGSSNGIAYAVDADPIVWTGLGTSIFTTGRGVIWTGSAFYAVGSGANTIATSMDGQNWTGFGNILFTTGYCVCYGNGIWVVGGEGQNTMAYSTDGVTWIGLGKIFRNSCRGISYNGSIFAATGDDYAADAPEGSVRSVYTSSDGATWRGIENSSRYLLTGYVTGVTPTIIRPGQPYQINGSSQSRLVIKYDPTSTGCTPQTAFDGVVPGSNYRLTDPSTTDVIHIPYQDVNGNLILDIEQAYNGYYIVDETLSSTTIVARKIIYYDYTTRLAYLESPFPDDWHLSDRYTLRRQLPIQRLVLSTERLPYINQNPAYGPIGPVIPFPTDALTTASSYVGKYVYYSSLPVYNPYVIGQFAAVYGNYYIRDYKADTREAFVDYAENVKAAYYNMPYPYTLLTGTIAAGSCSDAVILAGSAINKTADYYRGYEIVITETGESRYIIASNQYAVMSLNQPFYKPLQVGFHFTIRQTGDINIVSFKENNVTPLQYSGSMVSISEAVCYTIALLVVTVPNVPLKTGGRITNYPFIYVRLSNQTAPNRASSRLIYSNNPASADALFIAPVTEIVDPTTDLYIKLGNPAMLQTIKFKPNDNLYFSLFMPDGSPFETVQDDTSSPYPSNPLLQVHATFFSVRH